MNDRVSDRCFSCSIRDAKLTASVVEGRVPGRTTLRQLVSREVALEHALMDLPLNSASVASSPVSAATYRKA